MSELVDGTGNTYTTGRHQGYDPVECDHYDTQRILSMRGVWTGASPIGRGGQSTCVVTVVSRIG